tara:strand:+ start:21608 stop:22093 length:486 start_codon:yes stop_codon:yes gene_type:complete
MKPVNYAVNLILTSTLLCALTVSADAGRAQPEENKSLSAAEEKSMRITMEIDGQTINATLGSGSAAKDFYALLPLTLTLTDYAATEKVSDLPDSLSIQGEPSGTSAKAGDLTYYAPWGNLAIFYKDFHHASGLVKLGTMESGVDLLKKKKGAFDVTFRPYE